MVIPLRIVEKTQRLPNGSVPHCPQKSPTVTRDVLIIQVSTIFNYSQFFEDTHGGLSCNAPQSLAKHINNEAISAFFAPGEIHLKRLAKKRQKSDKVLFRQETKTRGFLVSHYPWT